MTCKIEEESFLSTLVYRNLCWAFGHEERVRIRRPIHDVFERQCGCRTRIGSQAEGLRYRIGIRDDNVDFITSKVYVEWPQSLGNDRNKCRYVMETISTPPGYCKLRNLPGWRYHADVYEAVPENRVYFSSRKFLQRCLERSVRNTVISGFSLVTQGSCKVVYSMTIPWPGGARLWIDRNPHRAWPPESLVREIVEGGCCLIPQGSSTFATLEWRFCFGKAEKQLVYSMSHFHFVLYQFVRIVVRDIVTKSEQAENVLRKILSPYVVKIVFFWVVEESFPNIATENKFGAFFDVYMDRLSQMISRRKCPNYFLPEDNLFVESLDHHCRHLILKRIQGVRQIGLKCILHCEWFTTLKASLREPLTSLETLKPSRYALETHIDETFFYESSLFNHSLMSVARVHSFVQCARETIRNNSLNTVEKAFFESNAVACIQSAGMCLYGLARTKQSNKGRYGPLVISKTFLSKKVRRDVAGRSLILATYLYLTGSYAAALKAIGKSVLRFKPYVIYNGSRYGIMGSADRDAAYRIHVCGRGWSLMKKARNALLLDLQVYYKDRMLPRELFLEMEILSDRVFGFFIIPPLPYTYFLQFLCLRQTSECCEGDLREADIRSVVAELQAVLYDEEKRGDYMVSHAMAGMCLEMIGEDAMALETYVNANRLAMKEKRGAESSTALWRIALLLNKKFRNFLSNQGTSNFHQI